MSLFSRFRKQPEKVEEVIPKVDLIIMEELSSDSDQYIVRLASGIIEGKPLIANFARLDPDGANKVIAFLSGVIYAIDGELLRIKEMVYMFATKDVYDDGTVRPFLDEIM